MTTWDPGARYPNPPLLLEGGFQKFLFAFPHHVTNPKARAPSSKIPGPSVYQAPSLAGLDYPDLDAGFMVTPSPSPKTLAAQRSGALQISKEPPSSVSTSSVPPSNAYPSLSYPVMLALNLHVLLYITHPSLLSFSPLLCLHYACWAY